MTIKSRIGAACEKSGRTQEAVKLVAVSKFHSVEKIKEALSAKHFIFAENYMQEGLEKQKEFSGVPIEWHFVGNIQQNKIKKLVGSFALIQSVDNFEKLEKMGKAAGEKGLIQKVLLEINIGDEDSKSGMPISEVISFYKKSLSVPNIIVSGLMCMPPLKQSEKLKRQNFAKMKLIFEKIKADFGSKDFHILSMGTSADFEMAIEEGSTMVRIGTEIFGSREEP